MLTATELSEMLSHSDYHRLRSITGDRHMDSYNYSHGWWYFVVSEGLVDVINSVPKLTNRGSLVLTEYDIRKAEQLELSKRYNAEKKLVLREIIKGHFSILEASGRLNVVSVVLTLKLNLHNVGVYTVHLVYYRDFARHSLMNAIVIEIDKIIRRVNLFSNIGKQVVNAIKKRLMSRHSLIYFKYGEAFDAIFKEVEKEAEK